MRMQAFHDIGRRMNLNRALRYCGMFKRAWYYVKKPRDAASLSASWGVGINEGRIHSKGSAESGIKNRGSDHTHMHLNF